MRVVVVCLSINNDQICSVIDWTSEIHTKSCSNKHFTFWLSQDEGAVGDNMVTSTRSRRLTQEEEKEAEKGLFRQLLSRHNQHTYAFDETAFAERVQQSLQSKRRALRLHHNRHI